MAWMFVAIIGPSGAGKSSCGKAASDNLSCGYIDLDSLVGKASGIDLGTFFNLAHGQSPSRFFDFGRDLCVVARSAAGGRDVLVAIGAGSIDYARTNITAVTDWFKDGFDVVICVTDDPTKAHARDPLAGRALEDYIKSEFSPHRLGIYSCANHTHQVSGRNEAESQQAFTEIARVVLGL